MPLELWFVFVTASAVILIVPGPTTTLVLATGLGEGRGAALRLVPGVVLGDLVAMTLSLAGVGALLTACAALFTLLKWAGATYLVWLGVRMWREARHLLAVTAEPAGQLPAKAFLVTLLNPKSLLFFVAFMPHFMQPDLPVAPQLLLMGATFLVLSGCNAAAYAMLSGGLARVLDAAARRVVHRLGAVSLMGMGVLTATLRRA
jgi:homoserine/homoserine lactone efflux protein